MDLNNLSGMSPEVITAIASVVIAVVAIGVGIWQGWIARDHNKRSTRPALRFDTGLIEKELVSVFVVNAGAGPAIIRGFEVWHGNVRLQGLWRDQLDELISRLIFSKPVEFRTYCPFEAETLAAGGRFSLLDFMTDDLDFANEIERVLTSLRFIIFYQSIYGEEFVLDGPRKRNPLTLG